MRSTIRLAAAGDAAAVAAIYAPAVEASWISFEEVAPDAGETAARSRCRLAYANPITRPSSSSTSHGQNRSDAAMRAAYRRSVDVSVYVADGARGRGIGRALYGALFAILRAQGFHRAFAGIALPNDASVALHRALGFTEVGVYREVGFKLGAWHDVVWLERALVPPGTPPREPVALPDVPADVLQTALQERL